MEDVSIVDCVCCWFDLLGYGGPFIENRWNLNSSKCKENIRRIKNVSEYFINSSSAYPIGTKLIFNDGFAHTIDIDINCKKSICNLLYFLEGSIKNFELINYKDKEEGFPGLRGIITCGERFSYASSNLTYDLRSKNAVAYYPKEFQMNTAFSKAFIMEETGSKAGISGSNLYIDISIYNLLQNCANDVVGRQPEVIRQKDCMRIKIYNATEWFANVDVDRKAIKFSKSRYYDNKGIETLLFKYRILHSCLDEFARDSAYEQMLRYTSIDET